MVAYDFFVSEFKQVLQQQYPSIAGDRLQSAIDKQWKSLSKKLKGPFESMANEDKQRYSKEMQQFKSKGTLSKESSQLKINRYNLSVHNQQLLKESFSLSKASKQELA